ncbi:unnamed protein product [Caenorhabditis bovis]|uniref:Uncharacterized protein n=1 Tax=Caenorhabditis bovis TaxID=2654633 RepID=A0A8S1EEA4_9PELO|nr:unnamed protein product [Caenorhabditis bovis]
MKSIRIAFLFVLVHLATGELRSQIYELPSLLVETDQAYLQKKIPTNLTCELSAGYSEARILSVYWILNNEFIEFNDTDYTWNGTILTVNGLRQQNEGDYQCLAEIADIRLANRQLITTKLISSPLKVRRARMTKFDKVLDHAITVRENEVARLPCAGIPDVIPGPPTICFERLGHNEGCLGTKNGTKHLTTSSGMQIMLVQPSDAGFYHCVVHNDFTNQTRKSPKPVLLYVRETNNTDKTRQPDIHPTLIFPAKETSIDKPIDVDVAEGEEVVLECVMSLAKIVWIKHNDSTPIISMNDNNSRFQQVWGNLKIRSVAHGDSGIYSCLGLPILGNTTTFDDTTRPRIDYNLIVHSPTGVHLSISPQIDKTYMLECLATNLRYEIPMAFVNGSSLSRSIELMGIPSNTNFYTNPIRVQLQVKTTFSGSVQCISRPAMDEAEIYGMGLERGKSMNMFIMSSHSSDSELIRQGPSNLTVEIGATADLPCSTHRGVKSWRRNNELIPLFSSRTKILGTNTLRITNVQKNDEGWYTCSITGDSGKRYTASAYLKVVSYTTPVPKTTTTEPFVQKKKDDKIDVEDVRGFVTGTEVRIQWSVLGKLEALTKISKFVIEVQRSGSEDDEWMEADAVDSHVRATTIKNLIPDNKYMFRIKMVRDNGSFVISQPTTWMKVEQLSGDVLPIAPKIDSVYQYTSESAKVFFSHNFAIDNAAAKTFVIVYGEKGDNKSLVTQVDGTQTEAIISGLKLDKTYVIHAIAENAAGKSLSSAEYLFNTTHSGMFSSVRIFFSSVQPYLTFKNIALFGIVTTLAIIVILVCCMVFCNLRTRKGPKTQANGKFLDTSYRIFNEQKVHKSRIFDDTNEILDGDIDECSPLKVKQVDERNDEDHDKFGFNADTALPNLYGNIDDVMEVENISEAPNDPTYVSASKLGGEYGVHSAARCYSPESRTSHEMLVSYSRSAPNSTTNSASPQMNGSMQRVKAYNYADSLLYSPAGTTSSIAETNSTGQPNRLNCESPGHPQSDESDQGIRCGGSSRSSHMSSSDGSKVVSMGTFKGNTPTNSFINTYDRRRSENVA